MFDLLVFHNRLCICICFQKCSSLVHALPIANSATLSNSSLGFQSIHTVWDPILWESRRWCTQGLQIELFRSRFYCSSFLPVSWKFWPEYWTTRSKDLVYQYSNRTGQPRIHRRWEHCFCRLLLFCLRWFSYRKLWNSSILTFQNHKRHVNWVWQNKTTFMKLLDFGHSNLFHRCLNFHTWISNAGFLVGSSWASWSNIVHNCGSSALVNLWHRRNHIDYIWKW